MVLRHFECGFSNNSIVMAGVERLRLLFLVCNVSGLLPFRMVLDAQTKRFKRFESHWRHPTNWWFIILLIGQICFLTIIYLSNWNLITRMSLLSLVTLVIFILLSSSFIIWLVCTIVSFPLRASRNGIRNF